MEGVLPLMLHCEYQLYKLYSGTPLRLNPFLSHWVEVVKVYGGRVHQSLKVHQNRISKEAYAGVRWNKMCGARLEMVKMILLNSNGKV